VFDNAPEALCETVWVIKELWLCLTEPEREASSLIDGSADCEADTDTEVLDERETRAETDGVVVLETLPVEDGFPLFDTNCDRDIPVVGETVTVLDLRGDTVTDGEPDCVTELRIVLETLTEAVWLLVGLADTDTVGVIVSVVEPIWLTETVAEYEPYETVACAVWVTETGGVSDSEGTPDAE
jgi:hypothetical protein